MPLGMGERSELGPVRCLKPPALAAGLFLLPEICRAIRILFHALRQGQRLSLVPQKIVRYSGSRKGGTMGTFSEWGKVLISGAFWGSFMMLFRVFKHGVGSKDRTFYLNLLLLAIASFFFGLWVGFGFRAFRWPLATITVPTIAAFILVRIIYNKRMKRLQSNNPSISA